MQSFEEFPFEIYKKVLNRKENPSGHGL